MGYRIDYNSAGAKRKSILFSEKLSKIKGKWLVLPVVLILLLPGIFNGRIRDFLTPGDPQVTRQSLQELVTDLQEGQPFTEALASFCESVLAHAQAME